MAYGVDSGDAADDLFERLCEAVSANAFLPDDEVIEIVDIVLENIVKFENGTVLELFQRRQ